MAARTPIAGSISLVTGAGSGIGRATALALAKKGSTVLAVDVNGDAAEKVAAECAETGAEAHGFSCDVRDADAVEALAQSTRRDHGTVTILVNNAGVGMSGPFLSMSRDDWEWIRSVNLDGVLNCCRSFVEVMIERRCGHVVNVSSGLGYTPRATEPAYVATKAAVLGFSLSVRADWARQSVGVSAICPGIINTPIIAATRFVGDRGDATAVERTQKLFHRGHSPDKVAAAITGAVEHDRAVVPVGWESWVGWVLHRYAPIGLQQILARQSPF